MPRGSLSLRLVEYFSDLFMRKGFDALQRHVRPDAVVVAGDMLDGARYMHRDAYQRSLQRYDWVFERHSAHLPVYNLSGNHDIGWGRQNREQQADYVRRFRRRFGKLNYRVMLGGFEWVFVSACTLTGDDTSDAQLHHATLDFVRQVGSTPRTAPRVLMSHVPLHRPHGTDCGSLRSSRRPIMPGHGRDYINALPPRETDYLLACDSCAPGGVRAHAALTQVGAAVGGV